MEFRKKLLALSVMLEGDWQGMCQKLSQDRELSTLDMGRSLDALARLESCPTVTILDPEYPAVLAQTSRPPFVLYYQGDLSLLDKPLAAFAGSKEPAGWSKAFCSRLRPALEAAGGAWVLGPEGGPALGPLSGTGGVRVWPAGLQEGCLPYGQNGLLLSECPPGGLSTRRHQHRSSRLARELGQALVVAELEKSDPRYGDCQRALELGTPVFVLPDRVGSFKSSGSLELLAQGAHPLTEERVLLDFIKK